MFDELTSAVQRHSGPDEDLNDLDLILGSDLTTDECFAQLATCEVLAGQDFRPTLLGGLVIGGLTLMFAGEILALVVGAVVLENLWSKHSKGTKALKEIQAGNFQPYLDEYDLRAYKRIMSDEPKAIAPSDIDEPAIAGAAMPPWAKDWNATQKQLWDKLIKDCPQMTLPIFSKLVVVSGPQQTGKSSLASAIAYCRFILRGDPTIAVTPHVDGKKMFSGLLVGAGGDFEEIEAWYEDLVSKFEMGGDRRTILIDELSQYTGDWEKLGQNIVRTALTESDKHGYSPILINHAQTVSAGFSGIPGVKALIDSSAIRILRQYELATWGEQTRSNTITMELPDGKKLSSTVPDWFHLPTLQKMFPVSLPQHQEAPEWLEQEIVQSGQVDEVAKLNRLYGLDAKPSPFDASDLEIADDEGDVLPSPKLNKDEAALLEFVKKRDDWVTARDVKNGCWFFKKSQHTTETIRDLFLDMHSLGIGIVDGEGQAMKFSL